MTNQFSKRICVVCNFQLTTFCHAKLNMVKAQKSLLKFIALTAKSKANSKKDVLVEYETTLVKSTNEDDTEVKEEEIIEEHLIDDENLNEITIQTVGNQMGLSIQNESSFVVHEALNTNNPNIFESLEKTKENFHNRDFYNQEFSSSKNLQSQIQNCKQKSPKITGLAKWKCHECNKTFTSGSSLTNHIAIYHSISTIELPCPVANCEKKCRTKKQLTQHLRTHNDDKQICSECGLVVGNKHNLTKHIRRLHLKIYNFYCDLCDYKGFFKFNIDQHMKKHLDKSEREKFYCDECQFESISKMSLRTHKRMEHLGQKKSYTCQCGKTFTQSSSYYTHVKVVHQKIKNHVCPYSECSKTFSEKSQLKNHIKSQHLKKRDIPCTVCGKLFSTQKHLTAHQKYHKPPSFICQYENCNNSFYTSTQLNSHYKVHNNQRDYACQLCEKKYFHRSHLKKHLLTHNNNICR